MSCQVELIPIIEGNRVTVKEEEKLIIGRGSSLGVGFRAEDFDILFVFVSVLTRKSLVNMRN